MESPIASRKARIIVSPRAAARLETAREWLADLPASTEAIVVGAVREAADDLLRGLGARRAALFAIHRMTCNRLIGLLAADQLAARLLAPADGLAAQAVAARTIYRLKEAGALGYFAPIATRPGFPGALATTLGELRLNGVGEASLRALGTRGATLAAILVQYAAELEAAGLADRPAIVAHAVAVAADTAATATRFIAIPIVLLDVPIRTIAERDFVRALAARAPQMLATVAAGDRRSLAMLEEALGVRAEPAAAVAAAGSALTRLQDHLFADQPPPNSALDASVKLLSAASELNECVEIARLIQAEARNGVPFDQIAILLHAPARYAPLLKEALDRADIPAYFAHGTAQPEPGGRALLTLLACAAERLSARCFAEYLSLAQVPAPGYLVNHDNGVTGFVTPKLDLAAAALQSDLDLPSAPPAEEPADQEPLPVVEGTLRAPWRWESLLVEAAVIGSRARWRRRLDGLAAELRLKRQELKEDDARAAVIDRQLVDLGHLREVALPIIDLLADLPAQATWAEWLERLRALAATAIRDNVAVLSALAELEPMAPVGPVGLDEARLVLADRLGRLEAPPPRRRYGAVFVAPTSYARGVEFEVVIVPGLTERVFPKKLTEDPILPDFARLGLGCHLTNQAERGAAERLALRLATGAARGRAIFTFPRVDLGQGRPRVPSFYALEILRAAEGRLPGFDELSRRAAADQGLRLGWPAPADPDDAIDEAEFDLAVLDRLLDADPATTTGAARYLLSVNEHLARALRSRARRWLRRWTPADGLIDPAAGASAVLERHRLSARSYSPTALQNFAACPYRFFLQAIHRLQPREEVEAIEAIDPLTRGAIFHEVQFHLLSKLRSAGLIPVSRVNLAAAFEILDGALERVAGDYRDRLAPAIERVWKDGIDSLGADLREWLRRAAEEPDGWIPDRFELAFGLVDRAQADPASQPGPVELDCGLKLRGSIDLVERREDGRLRVTDHKTGRAWAPKGVALGGGRVLQPILYAMAAERLLGAPVESGQLYYCTAAGGYARRSVTIGETARAAIGEVASVIGTAVEQGFMPAAPGPDECRLCDYRLVCGPYEAQRAGRKPAARLAALARIRGTP